MSTQQWLPSYPDRDLLAHLTVEVERMPGRPLWAWNIVDNRFGKSYQSGHSYESESEAERAGRARLAELTRSLPGAKAGRRLVGTGSNNHLIVVSRYQDTLFGVLSRLFEDHDGIEVVRDRREHSVSRHQSAPDRRSTSVDASSRERGWWMVCSHTAADFGHRQESA
jgi:hypothetical protein